MKPTTLFLCATVVAACANVTAPTSTEAARLAEARALLAEQPMRALDVAESLLAENPDWSDARLVAAEGSLRLARSGSGQAHLHLVDAANNFDKALLDVPDADAPAALMMLAECRYELGEFEDAHAAAVRAAKGFAAVNVPVNRTDAASALLLAGRCDLMRLVAAREAEKASGTPDRRGVVPIGSEAQSYAARAAEAFHAARAEFPGEATIELKRVFEWLDQPNEALKVIEHGLRQAPAETAIHDAYIDWMLERGQYDALLGGYSRLVRENPSTPVLRWHQGRAVYFHGDKLRREGNFQGALAAYGKADGIFGEYVAMVPAHREAGNQWRASCSLSMARTACDMGDLATAERHLLQSIDSSPVTTQYEDGKPLLVDSFGNHFAGAAFAIHKALTETGDDALSRTLAFNDRVLQRCPDQWGFLYNNAALAARDLGVRKAQAGEDAAAMELWERAYRWYERALVLSPDDARVVNDCGLMLIYHLDRDFDRARQLFERAITLGKAQLEALPATAAARDRELLEESIGDAWQNLAVLTRDQLHRPFAEYRTFCEESVKYFPYQRREAAALLRTDGAEGLQSTARSALLDRQAQQQSGAAEALAKKRADIDAKVKAADHDGALALLDELAKTCKDHAPFHLLKGDVTMLLANQARTDGRKGVELFFQDAVAAYKRAVELDTEPVAPRQKLAQAQYDSGDVEGATRTLSAMLLHMQSQGGGKPEDLLAVHTLRANAAARAYTQKKQNNDDDKELLTAARASFRLVEEKGKLDQPLTQLWAATEQWAGAPAEAVNVYVRALQRTPDDATLFESIVNTAAATGQVTLAADALAKRDDATALWYQGTARRPPGAEEHRRAAAARSREGELRGVAAEERRLPRQLRAVPRDVPRQEGLHRVLDGRSRQCREVAARVGARAARPDRHRPRHDGLDQEGVDARRRETPPEGRSGQVRSDLPRRVGRGQQRRRPAQQLGAVRARPRQRSRARREGQGSDGDVRAELQGLQPRATARSDERPAAQRLRVDRHLAPRARLGPQQEAARRGDRRRREGPRREPTERCQRQRGARRSGRRLSREPRPVAVEARQGRRRREGRRRTQHAAPPGTAPRQRTAPPGRGGTAVARQVT
jgi:tetratricopeptide (TPR) repeat protein